MTTILKNHRYDYCTYCDRFRHCAVFGQPNFNLCINCLENQVEILKLPKTIAEMEKQKLKPEFLIRLSDEMKLKDFLSIDVENI